MRNHSDNTSKNIALTPTERLTRTALAAAVICILGPLSVPIPVSLVPLSLTHLGIYLAAYTLGRKDATAATLIYLVLGAVGLPVFSGFSGGFAKLAGPTGGYLLGFVMLTFAVAAAVDRYDGKRGPVALAMLMGNLAVYAFGTAWLAVSAHLSFGEALAMGVAPYVVFDVIKAAAALAVGPVIRERVRAITLKRQ
ncbi:MAG: biotin transporter BioY [Eubacteriaceae bacterium]|nr:biotin transporter BioY [Eubacteriaceae bacterium]